MKRFIAAAAGAAALLGLAGCGGSSPEALSPTAEATLQMIQTRMAAASAADRTWACEEGWSGVLTVTDLPYRASGPQAAFAKDREAAAEAYIAASCGGAS